MISVIPLQDFFCVPKEQKVSSFLCLVPKMSLSKELLIWYKTLNQEMEGGSGIGEKPARLDFWNSPFCPGFVEESGKAHSVSLRFVIQHCSFRWIWGVNH